MDYDYVHIRWPNGQDDMVPASTAQVRADCGDFTIVDPTPAPYQQFKARVPLGTSATPTKPRKPRTSTSRPKRTPTPAARQVTEPAPEGPTPEEAQA